MRNRTKAREIALKFLYQVDLRGRSALDEMDEFLEVGDPPDEIVAFSRELIDGVLENQESLDERIRQVAQNWDLERMAVIDRNALRISAYELEHRPDIPAKVSINEAIELGKRYSTENSGAFINGILDRICAALSRTVEPDSSPVEEESAPGNETTT